MARTHRIGLALLTTASWFADSVAYAQANEVEQEQAAETSAEGEAKARGQNAVPTSEELSPRNPQTLEEIVVTGEITYRNRTETIAPELTFDQEFFQKFEPTSVGDSLKRVPGVAFGSDIGEYDLPALRGLGAGFTQILVNGRPIPGAGNDRTVFVDRIPAEIIDRIEIIRSPSADIDSQGIGGSINIILKDGASLPPGIIARAGALYYPDDGTIKGSGAVSLSGRNEAETVAYSLTVDAQQRYNPKLSRQEVFNDDVPGFDDTETGLDLFKPFDRAGSIAVEREEQLDTRRSFDLSFNGDVTFRLSPDHQVRVDGFYIRTRRHDTEHSFALERDEPDDPYEFDEVKISREPHQQDNFGVSTLYEGELDETTSLEARLGYSQFKEIAGDYTYQIDTDGLDPVTFKTGDVPGLGNGVLTESDDINSLDKEWSLDGALTKRFGPASIKVGFAGKIKDRDFHQITLEDLDEDEPSDVTEGSGAFQYKEKRLDGFVVNEWEFGAAKLQVGARAEYTKTRQILPVANDDGETRAASSEFHLNPSAHLEISAGGGLQFRASVAKTVRRPSIDQVVPFSDRDNPEDDDITRGNPDLSFETSWGVDVGLEQRIGNRGIVGANFFYRWVDNLIGLANTGLPADPDDPDHGQIYTFENTGKGRVYGIEFDLSTPLTVIGLDDTGLFGNFTRLWSRRTEPQTGLVVPFDGQPKYVYNFGITQEIPGPDMSFGFSYRKQGEAVSTFFGEEEHQFYGAALEAFVEKRFGKNFVLRLTGSNLLDAASTQYERNFDGDSGAEIIANQRDGNVDEFEVEHEEASPQLMLTARMVF